MAYRPTIRLPRGAGTAIFAGGGAWLPRTIRLPETTDHRATPGGAATTGRRIVSAGIRRFGGAATINAEDRADTLGDEALILSDPCRVLAATTPDQVATLLAEVEAEQRRGRFVAGYLAYEAGDAFGLTVRAQAPDALPLGWMAVYPAEHATMIPAATWRRFLDEIDVTPVAAALADIRPELSVTREEYVEAIRRVREFIAAGDTYQVNYTVRGRYRLGSADAEPERSTERSTEQSTEQSAGASAPVDPLDYFLALVVRQAVPYAAYFDLGDAQVISLSPEMFLRRRDNRLSCRPMKGTRPRGNTHAEDVALAYELAETEKERAENLMIVDMVRNDLGRVCRAGSVRVPALYTIEPYRTVWQTTSTVIGDVNPLAGLVDIMEAVFPGASITGAPKYHTMEIIAALETEPRDAYTGAIGCFYPGGDFTTSIGIRTIVHRQGRCRLGVGSGVVWDADAAAEYEETLTKAAFATPPSDDLWRPDPVRRLRTEDVRLFETILLEALKNTSTGDDARTVDGPPDTLNLSLQMSDAAVLARYVFLDDHLDRMAASAAALGFPFDRLRALNLLVGLARLKSEAVAVHLELTIDGVLTQSSRPARPAVDTPVGPVTLLVSPFRTDPDDPFLRHKTTVRGFYNREHRRAVGSDCVDALFLNRLDLVTEGAITNIAARYGDQWVTPPLADGLLPGIWRAHLIAERGAEECSLTLEELLAADEIVVGNSVRGAVSVARVTVAPVIF